MLPFNQKHTPGMTMDMDMDVDGGVNPDLVSDDPQRHVKDRFVKQMAAEVWFNCGGPSNIDAMPADLVKVMPRVEQQKAHFKDVIAMMTDLPMIQAQYMRTMAEIKKILNE